jgi:hypothetical protein
MSEAAAAVEESLPPWREPVRGGYTDAKALSLPGLEQLRGIVDGRSERPPIAVANAQVRDADGKPVALATGSAMLLPGTPAALAGPPPD